MYFLVFKWLRSFGKFLIVQEGDCESMMQAPSILTRRDRPIRTGRSSGEVSDPDVAVFDIHVQLSGEAWSRMGMGFREKHVKK